MNAKSALGQAPHHLISPSTSFCVIQMAAALLLICEKASAKK